MNNYFEKIREKLKKYKNLGELRLKNGSILIGHLPAEGINAYCHSLFKPLNESDIKTLEKELKMSIPNDYAFFLTQYSNGIRFFMRCFALDGLRKQLGRDLEASAQPFALSDANVWERPKNSKPSYFFIGGYGYDASSIYIDADTNKVHYCARRDATSLFEWENFEHMIVSETERIFSLYDDKGNRLVSGEETLPIR